MLRRTRVSALVSLALALVTSAACRKHHNSEADGPLAVRVYRDPASPSSALLVQATKQFVSSHPHAANNRKLMISLSASTSYTSGLSSLEEIRPQIVILNAEADLPSDSPVRSHLGDAETICGSNPAYLPDWNTPEERDSALQFLQFLRDHCVQPAPASQPAAPSQNAPTPTSPTHTPAPTNP